MLHAEFLCDVFCCDFLLSHICFSEPYSLTYLEVFIDILMIYIILDWNISSAVSMIFWCEPVVCFI